MHIEAGELVFRILVFSYVDFDIADVDFDIADVDFLVLMNAVKYMYLLSYRMDYDHFLCILKRRILFFWF